MIHVNLITCYNYILFIWISRFFTFIYLMFTLVRYTSKYIRLNQIDYLTRADSK